MDASSKYALLVAAVFAGLIVLSRFKGRAAFASSSTTLDRATLAKYRAILDQVKHWSLASKQDSEILLALVHITTALAKAHALSGLITNTSAEKNLDVNLDKLIATLTAYQQKVLDGFRDAAPDIALAQPVDLDLFV